MNAPATLEWSLGAWRVAADGLTLAALAAVIAAVLLTAWRASRRLADAGALRRLGVIALNLLAGAAVSLLLLSPSKEREADATVVLVTEGARDGSAEPTADRAPTLGRRYHLLPQARDAASTGSETAAQRETPATGRLAGETLVTAGQLILREPGLDALSVLGHGLDDGQWRELPSDLQVRFEPPPLAGPVQVQWRPRLVLGEALTVTGVLRLEGAEDVADVELVDPAGGVVATAPARSGQGFAVTTTPRGVGALEYRLRGRRGNTSFFDEPVSVQVVTREGARLMVIQSAPSFETRRLANWAADTGHALIVHSQVSRDRDLAQGINLEAGSPLERTAAQYAETDLVLMDGRRWAALPDQERQTVLDAVRSGLGLLLLADPELAAWLDTPAHAALVGLDLLPAPAVDPVWPSWPGLAPEQPLPLAPFRLALDGARSLTRDENGLLLEALQPVGDGRIGVSLLRERHRWATSGESSTFARYWARLLSELARTDLAPRWLTPQADVRAFAGRRMALCAPLGNDTALALRLAFHRLDSRDSTSRDEAEAVPLVPHAAGAGLQCAVVWPDTPGWHVAGLVDNQGNVVDELLIRVHGPEHWEADRHARRQLATLGRAATGMSGPDTGVERRRVETPLSPWWPWALLLLAGGALWAERRLFELD
ncbi:MAG: hypothetical protein V2I57_05910 [Xanthomonadales bacterium]|nr:hypothetical protein [Xanthomonadales bacterium]